MVAEWSGSLLQWEGELQRLKERFGAALRRRELRDTASAFLDGLLSSVERKTGWLMAEQAGLGRPYRMQSLLGRSSWSADDLRDVVRGYALEALGDPDGVLVVTRPAFSRKANTRSEWRDNIRAQRGGSRTAKWVCSSPTPAASVRR